MISIPRVGQKIDNYELLSVLGEGGLGVVFRARQSEVGRLVAIKVLHAHIVDEEFQSRFLREAQILNKLSHVNIVTVYHMGVSDTGLLYLVMEMVEGRSLRQILFAEDKLDTLRALKITRDAAKALSYVHKNGIVHRDLKLENIILVQEPEPETVKIIDFGLAGLSQQQNQKLTKTGALVGTAAYMSPEQCTGQKVDHRSDIYSLAICLYEILTGVKPFEADNPVGVMYQHMNNTTPSLQAKGTLSKYISDLDELIAHATEKLPADRFQNMDEFARAIDDVIDVIEGHSESKPGRKRTNRTFQIVSAVALIFMSILCLPLLHQNRSNGKMPRFEYHEKTLRYSENAITDTMASGNAKLAMEMCDSTLKFELPVLQRIRILILRGELSRSLESVYYFTKAAALCQNKKYKLLKLSCYTFIGRTLIANGMNAEGIRFLHKVQTEYNGEKLTNGGHLEFCQRDQLDCLVAFAEDELLRHRNGAREYLSMAVLNCQKQPPEANACWTRLMVDICKINDSDLAKRLIKSCPLVTNSPVWAQKPLSITILMLQRHA